MKTLIIREYPDYVTLGHAIQSLLENDLWPLPKMLQYSDFSEIRKLTSEIKDCDGGDCSCPEVGLRWEFGIWVQEALDSQKGLCLECFRQGKLSKGEGNCQGDLQCNDP